ncbi:MAG: hypothetical protein RR128_09130 [Clostridium sp.]
MILLINRKDVIRRGEIAIVIFYVGIFLAKIDERVINTAEEVGMPLICMPENSFN